MIEPIHQEQGTGSIDDDVEMDPLGEDILKYDPATAPTITSGEEFGLGGSYLGKSVDYNQMAADADRLLREAGLEPARYDTPDYHTLE